MAGWRLEADLDLCQAHQMCRLEAPEVFGFDKKEDKVSILIERPTQEQIPLVRKAVAACPSAALTLIQVPDGEEAGA